MNIRNKIIASYVNDVVDVASYKQIVTIVHDEENCENLVFTQSTVDHALNREGVHPLTDDGWNSNEDFSTIVKDIISGEDARIMLCGDLKGPYGGDKGARYILSNGSIYCMATEYITIGCEEFYLITSIYRCNKNRYTDKVKLVGSLSTTDNFWRKKNMSLDIDYVSDESISELVYIDEKDIRVNFNAGLL